MCGIPKLAQFLNWRDISNEFLKDFGGPTAEVIRVNGTRSYHPRDTIYLFQKWRAGLVQNRLIVEENRGFQAYRVQGTSAVLRERWTVPRTFLGTSIFLIVSSIHRLGCCVQGLLSFSSQSPSAECRSTCKGRRFAGCVGMGAWIVLPFWPCTNETLESRLPQ